MLGAGRFAGYPSGRQLSILAICVASGGVRVVQFFPISGPWPPSGRTAAANPTLASLCSLNGGRLGVTHPPDPIMPILLFVLIAAISLVTASAQSFAPSSIPSGSRFASQGTVVEGGVSYPDFALLRFSGSSVTDGSASGTFSYSRTSATTATLTYSLSYSDPDVTRTRNGSAQLTFTASGVGTYTSSGSYSGVEFGGSFSGNFTGSGTFQFTLPVEFPAVAVSDNFNDNAKDAAKWGADFNLEGAGTLREIRQRLEFTSSASGFRDAGRPWILEPPAYDHDWEVVVDVTNLLNSNGYAGLGLEIIPRGNRNHVLWFDFSAERASGAEVWRGFEVATAGGARASESAATTTASLRISFNAVTKVLSCYYDHDGPAGGHSWFPVASLGINGTGGTTGNQSWGMSGSDTFQISVAGFSDATSVAASRLYFDDFRVSPRPAVPPPPPPPGVSDDFDDGGKDPLKWGDDFSGIPAEGLLNEVSGHLEYTSAGDLSRELLRPWISNPPGLLRDWEVIVDVHHSVAAGGDAGFGIQVAPVGDPDHAVRLGLFASPGGGVARGFRSSLDGQAGTEVASLSPLAALRIRYDAAAKVIFCYYDADGPANGYVWQLLSSYGIRGSGGAGGNSLWEMSPTRRFQISLFGISNATAVAAGAMYFDDFRVELVEPEAALLSDWKRHFFGSPDAVGAADEGDPDLDGIPNLLEFAFGLDPIVSDRFEIDSEGEKGSRLPTAAPIGDESSRILVIEYLRRRAITHPGIIYQPQFSDDLTGSGPGGWELATGIETVEVFDAEWERVSVQDHGTPGKAARFGRVVISHATTPE